MTDKSFSELPFPIATVTKACLLLKLAMDLKHCLKLYQRTKSTLTPPSTADVTELGDDNEVGVVQALPILSSELVDEDLDSSLRFSLEPRLFDSNFSTCLCWKRQSIH